MKATYLTRKLLTFIILLGLIFSISNCNSDDDIPPTSNTFLELYDGTTWVISDDDENLTYIRLISNENSFAEAWEYWDVEDCYEHDNSVLEGSIEIIENSKDRFIVKVVIEGYTETVTISMQGESLKVVVNWADNGESGENISYLDRTLVDVDALKICD